MRDYSNITDGLKVAVNLHFKRGVPICDLSIRKEQRDIFQRSDYLLTAYRQNPSLDPYRILYDMGKMRYLKQDGSENCVGAAFAAKRDEQLFRYILDVLGLPQPPEHEPHPAKNQARPAKPKEKQPEPKPAVEAKPKPVPAPKPKTAFKTEKPVKPKKVVKPRPLKDGRTPLYFLRLDNFCKEYALDETAVRKLICCRKVKKPKDYGIVATLYFLMELSDRFKQMAIVETAKQKVEKDLSAMNRFINMDVIIQELFHPDTTFSEWRKEKRTPEEIHLINETFTEFLPETIENFVGRFRQEEPAPLILNLV